MLSWSIRAGEPYTNITDPLRAINVDGRPIECYRDNVTGTLRGMIGPLKKVWVASRLYLPARGVLRGDIGKDIQRHMHCEIPRSVRSAHSSNAANSRRKSNRKAKTVSMKQTTCGFGKDIEKLTLNRPAVSSIVTFIITSSQGVENGGERRSNDRGAS